MSDSRGDDPSAGQLDLFGDEPVKVPLRVGRFLIKWYDATRVAHLWKGDDWGRGDTLCQMVSRDRLDVDLYSVSTETVLPICRLCEKKQGHPQEG